MRKPSWRLGLPFLLLVLPGCGGTPEAPPPELPPPSIENGQLDPPLAGLLARPRAELAQLADDVQSGLPIIEQGHHEAHKQDAVLFPFMPPLVVPVWCEAHYHARLGISLPPYLSLPGSGPLHDNDQALHVARYGDVEAARLLADPDNKEVQARLDACRLGRNYPLEWTRLVALRLHAAQLHLAAGEIEGGAELVALHRELRQVLDAGAARSPLGVALLTPGRTALQHAAAAWRENKQTDLVRQAEGILAAWGEPAADGKEQRGSLVPLGQARGDVARLFRAAGQGRCLSPANKLRAFDLLNLPFSAADAEAVFAFFDGTDRLSDVVIVCPGKAGERYREVADLAQPLLERGAVAGEPAQEPAVRRCAYRLDGLTYEAALVSRHNLGALVQISRSKEPAAGKPAVSAVSLPRAVGLLNLDRSFEQNRVRLAPEQSGDTLEITRPQALAEVVNPLPLLEPGKILLTREPGRQAASAFELHYPLPAKAPPLSGLLGPLWSAWGPTPGHGVSDEHGGHLAFAWQDGRTRCTLRLPHDVAEPVVFAVQDLTAQEKDRDEKVLAFDRAERQARFAAGKLWMRLPRSLDAFAVQLGMTREQALESLPGGRGVLTRDVPDGLTVVLAGQPDRKTALVPRQVFVRFSDNRVAEVRVRYQDLGTGKPGVRAVGSLVAALKKAGGAPAEAARPSWAALWPELGSAAGKPVLLTWQDDATLLSCQHDALGAEVILRDCPADHPEGAALAPFTYLARGVENCHLGDDREALLRKWNVKSPTVLPDGAVVLPGGDNYDVVLVWFSGGKVARVVARHAQPKTLPEGPQQLAGVLNGAWLANAVELGWPRRQEQHASDALQGLGWHDDQTRVRMFWQETRDGTPKLYTEWRSR
jgi:hypothetical protein